ncbi:MAG TPA: AraC family transcriptional regulator [Marinagarivorans sp.]
MNTLIFNVNDLALLLLVAQSALLILILLLVRAKAGAGNGLLAGLLMAFALQAIDTLLYWSVPIKAQVAQWGVWPFWLLKWAPFIQGPLLYAYIRARITGAPVRWRDSKHLIPVLLYPFVVAAIFWQLGDGLLSQGVYDYGVWFNSGAFTLLVWAYKVSGLAYGALCISYLRRHAKHLEQAYSNPSLAEPRWLVMVVGGFVALWLWQFLAGVAEGFSWSQVSHVMGVLANYFSFAFITSLVFYSLLKSQVVAPPLLEPLAGGSAPTGDDEAAAKALQMLLQEQSLHLNPELTVEDLARAARMPDRQVSQLINTCLGKNFFEFVNEARVNEAKRLLTETSWPVQRVLEESGFNSKATFNRIFKRYVEQTPSDYRKRQKA